MAKDKLIITADDHAYGPFRISWFLGDEADLGATLGDSLPLAKYRHFNKTGTFKSNEDLHVLATILCMTYDAKLPARDIDGFFWEFKTQAKAVLKYVASSMKVISQAKSWPAWALKAKAAGWTPPKNWVPE